jgi:hypothetical protein
MEWLRCLRSEIGAAGARLQDLGPDRARCSARIAPRAPTDVQTHRNVVESP